VLGHAAEEKIAMAKTDRRVQRTRDMLQQALTDLIRERGYAAITIQDIVDRANVGRTTFYLHYTSKDDLFMHCHEAVVSAFHVEAHASLSREALLSPDEPPGMRVAYRHLAEARALLAPIFQGEQSLLIVRRIRDRSAAKMEASLQAAFAGRESSVPLDLLAHTLAGAQLALLQWWLEQRRPHTPEALARTFHRLRRAAIRDAFGLGDAELVSSKADGAAVDDGPSQHDHGYGHF
jgi:AcrR family transcriptional regulator